MFASHLMTQRFRATAQPICVNKTLSKFSSFGLSQVPCNYSLSLTYSPYKQPNMKLLYTTILLLCVGLQLQAQKTLPYTANFDTKAEQDEWTQYRMGSDKFYDWDFSTATNGFLSHDYPVGAESTDTTYDWMVSPAIDLSNGAEIALSVSGYTIFEVSADDYFGIWVSTGSADPADGDYTEVADLTNFSLANQYKDTSGLDVKSKALDGHIAFVYKAVQNWYTIAIDSVEIKASTTGIDDAKGAVNARLWYSANGAELTINEEQAVQYSITDINGRALSTGTIHSGSISLHQLAPLPKGMYVVSITSHRGVYSSKYLVQ